jgi:hypothetical protein
MVDVDNMLEETYMQVCVFPALFFLCISIFIPAFFICPDVKYRTTRYVAPNKALPFIMSSHPFFLKTVPSSYPWPGEACFDQDRFICYLQLDGSKHMFQTNYSVTSVVLERSSS